MRGGRRLFNECEKVFSRRGKRLQKRGAALAERSAPMLLVGFKDVSHVLLNDDGAVLGLELHSTSEAESCLLMNVAMKWYHGCGFQLKENKHLFFPSD